MRSAIQEKILDLLYKALRPLVHLLIESGVGHREFSEVAKRAYVDIASENYGIRGRQTNVSRVAVMTGLTRKEVKRVRDEYEQNKSFLEVKQVPAARLLQYWHTDEEFLDDDGNPLVLNFSDDEPSFFELTRKYAGDIPAGALRTELSRSGAVTILDDGRLQARRREFRFIDPEEQFVWALEGGIFGAISNCRQNYFARQGNKKMNPSTWPSRLVDAVDISRSDLSKVREIARSETSRFAEVLDDAIAPYAEKNDDADSATVHVSIVYFEETNHQV